MAGPGGGVSFMRMIFQVTKESVEEKEGSIRSMVDGYKKKTGDQQVQDKSMEGRGNVAVGGKKSADALSTAQSLELQFEMGQYTQMATGGSNIVKSIKDLLSAIMRNVS